MGFRSNFIASVSGYEIPTWFKEKYPDWEFLKGNQACFAQLYESKFYSSFKDDERFIDIQKMLIENKQWRYEIIVILLHECNGITRIKITKDSITAKEPTEWKDVDQVEHDYCYQCVDKLVVNIAEANN